MCLAMRILSIYWRCLPVGSDTPDTLQPRAAQPFAFIDASLFFNR